MEQFKSNSWREHNITIESKEVFDLSFLNTKPNMFYIQNPNFCKLKISISKYPTSHEYEFMVSENTSEPIGRPSGTGHLYILNTGEVTARVKIYSIEKEFDMNILKNFNFNIDGVTFDTASKISFDDGVSLPSGTNNIGVVSLDNKSANNLAKISSDLTTFENAQGQNMNDVKGLMQNIITNGVKTNVVSTGIDVDNFYKKTVDKYLTADELGLHETTDKILTDNSGLGIIKLSDFSKVQSIQNDTSFVINSTIVNDKIATLKVTEQSLGGVYNINVSNFTYYNVDNAVYIDSISVINEIKKVLEADYWSVGNNSKIIISSSIREYMIRSHEDVSTSGILNDCKKIVNDGSRLLSINNNSQELYNNGQLLFNKIDFINVLADTETAVNIDCYTNLKTNYKFTLKMKSGQILPSLERDIYKIIVSSTGKCDVNIIGGLY